MRRATTPTYIFTFPFAVSQLDDLTITFKQGSRSIVKHKEDGDIEDVKFSFTLTQQETKTFCEGNCKGQVKLLAGSRVLGSTIFDVKVRPILDDTAWNIPDGETEEEQTTETVVVAPIAPTGEIFIDEYEQSFEVTFTESYVMGGGGTGDYTDLTNKPSINGVTLEGNKTSAQLGLQDTLSTAQQNAVDSGITSEKVAEYDGYGAEIEGKYEKPSGGIPKTDLAQTVQDTLDKVNNLSASDISVDDSSEYWSAEVENAQEALDLLAEDTYNAGQNAAEAKALIQDHTTDISLSQSDYSSGNYHVKDEERTAWNGKYEKPSGGIPSTDMTQAVRTSLGKADTAVQPRALDDYVSDTELGNMLDLTVDSSSDDDHIPTSKAVYTAITSAVNTAILTALNTPV